MKSRLCPILFLTVFALRLWAQAPAPDFPNGDFSADPQGKDVVITAPLWVSDTQSIMNWRVFNANSAAQSFSATLVEGPDGGNAIELNATGVARPGEVGIDRNESKIEVAPGVKYDITYQAEYVSGAGSLWVLIQEFDGSAQPIGTAINHPVNVTDKTFKEFTIHNWQAQTADVAQFNIAFLPMPATPTGQYAVRVARIAIKVAQ